ncbi:phosphatase PAP2 family protein [Mesorhizobium sp. BAC0120]|nr:phosphatase PAP2 family protein [Mesorhizobium sp. BAC0120]
MRPHRRLATALVGARQRLMRGRSHSVDPIWTPEMSRWLAVGLCLALIASLTDAAAIRYVHGSQDAIIAFMAYITNVGKSQWFLVPAALIFLAVGLLDWSRQGMRGKARLSFLFGQAAYVFSAVALSGIFVNIVKVIFGRARPRLIDEVGPFHFDPFTFGYLHASFPSGHSTTVGAIVGIVMIWYPRWRLVTIELGLFFAATRIAAGAHYPSDVATGFLVGIFFSIVIARWLASRGAVFRFVAGKVLPVPAATIARKSRT